MKHFDKEDLIRKTNEVHKKYPIDKEVSTIREVCYGDVEGRKLYLDIYTPTEIPNNPRPAIVFVHGGSWMVGNKDQFLRQASHLAKVFNMFAVTISYRLNEEAKFPAPIHDVKAAVRWVRSQAGTYNIDVDRIAICGGSAGAHIASMAALTRGIKEYEGKGGNQNQDSTINLAVLFNGEYDLVDVVNNDSCVVPLKVFFGKSLKEDEDLYRKASPLEIANSNMPPTLFLHGTKDDCVSHKQSISMHKRLKELGVYSEIEIYEGKQHAWFNFKNDYKETLKRMEKFIKEQFLL